MLGFSRKDGAERGEALPQAALGRLELSVMEIVWAWGESSVRDVVHRLERPLAYTTVMTTLDRLFKKGVLARRKSDRAFLYTPTHSRLDWQRKMASDLLTRFFAGTQPPRELLLSSLVDAIGEYDETLLQELEDKIRAKRKERLRRVQP